MTQVLRQLQRIDEVMTRACDVGFVLARTDKGFSLLVQPWRGAERSFLVQGETVLDAIAQAAQVLEVALNEAGVP